MNSQIFSSYSGRKQILYGEFDSGSERTLAAWIRHASRTGCSNTLSGARVRNTWATCPGDWDSPPKGGLIPDAATEGFFGTLKVAQATAPGWARGLSASW